MHLIDIVTTLALGGFIGALLVAVVGLVFVLVPWHSSSRVR